MTRRDEVQRIINALDAALDGSGAVVAKNDLIPVRTGLVALRDEPVEDGLLDVGTEG